MGKAWMTIGIIIGVLVLTLFLISTLAPQGMADFFMGMGAASYEVDIAGKEYKIDFREMEEGLDGSDRLFLMKKMVAFEVFNEEHENYTQARDEYIQTLVEASEDHLLTQQEFLALKEMHSDVMPEQTVNNWIQIVKDMEEKKQRSQ